MHWRLPHMLDVLIVDDDSDLRNALADCVDNLGYRVRQSADGEEALEAMQASRADIVLTDWMLPRLDGLDLCRRLKGAPLPPYLILMTALGSGRLVEGTRAGADDFMSKPIDLDVLDVRLLAASRLVRAYKRLAEQNARLLYDSERSLAIARADALTGVGNRLALDEEMRRIVANASRYAQSPSIAMCDIDYFKQYNDRYGHVAGDAALRQVAATIRASVRAGDSVYRYGGEEFAVILPEQDVMAAARAMDRVRAAVQGLAIRHAKVSRTGTLTMSVGVASHRKDGEDWLARADRALYRAKAEQRNCVRWDPLSLPRAAPPSA
jgi:two-component system cell cycle response regulator